MTISSDITIKAYQLRFGSRFRMEILKAIAADSVNNRNEATWGNPGDWRGARHYKLNTFEGVYMSSLHCGFNGEGFGRVPVWVTHCGAYFRNERDADSIINSLPSGWFTDCDETAVGIVASLPHGRFIAGYRWTSNGERVYFPEVYTDESDAACAADSHAERFAELSREHSEKYDAMRDAEEECEGLCEKLQGMLRGRNASEYLRACVWETIAQLRKARETLDVASAAYEKG